MRNRKIERLLNLMLRYLDMTLLEEQVESPTERSHTITWSDPMISARAIKT